MNTQSKSKRLGRVVSTLVAIVVLVATVSPVQADETPASIDSTVVYGHLETENGIVGFGFTDYANGIDRIYIYGNLGIDSRPVLCQSQGEDILLPESDIRGKDLLVLTATFQGTDFQGCNPDTPDVITLDLVLEAGTVIHQKAIKTTTVVKGNPTSPVGDSHTDTWIGRDLIISGTVNGAAVTAGSGQFTLMKELFD